MKLGSVIIVLVVVVVAAAGGWAVGSGTVEVAVNLDSDDEWNETSLEAEILNEINNYRAEQSLFELRSNARIADAARAHATDMHERDYYNHTTPDGTGVRERYQRCSEQSEIINAVPEYERQYDTGEFVSHVVDQWRDSDAHRRIMLADWARAGVGVELDGSEAFVVVGFCE